MADLSCGVVGGGSCGWVFIVKKARIVRAFIFTYNSVVVSQLIQDGWVFQRRGVLRDGFVLGE